MGKYLKDYQIPDYYEEDKPRMPKRPKKFKDQEGRKTFSKEKVQAMKR